MARSVPPRRKTPSRSTPKRDVRPSPITPTTAASEPFLTVNDVAALMPCAIKTVYRKIAQRILPAFRIAGSRELRIRRADVEQLLVPTMSSDQASADLDAFINNKKG